MGDAKEETVLILTSCDASMVDHFGFQWPPAGRVATESWHAPPSTDDWLAGLLWGEGSGELMNWNEDAKWLIVEVFACLVVQVGDFAVFPAGEVVFCGDRLGATSFMTDRAPGKVVVGGTATAGDNGTATAGDNGTATAGYRGTATAGDRSTATAGDSGTATAGYRGNATAGDRGTATAGDRGTATAGYRGNATAGDSGTATAGDSGTATAGDSGTATAGDGGIVTIKFWDDETKRWRLAVGYVGEDGIVAGTAYRVQNGRLVEVKP